jgi:hypothetical protein
VELIEADRREEVVGPAGVGEAVRGLWLLPKAEAGVRRSRAGKVEVGVARRGRGQEGTSGRTCRGGSARITRRIPVLRWPSVSVRLSYFHADRTHLCFAASSGRGPRGALCPSLTDGRLPLKLTLLSRAMGGRGAEVTLTFDALRSFP